MKIVSSGKVLNSREFYKKKTRKRRIQLILLLVIFISVTSLFVYLSRQERFLITEVVIPGENVIDREEITQTARRLLDGHYLLVIPRANAFIYPRRAIRQSLNEKFPRLKSIDLNLDELQTLIITVEERVPFAMYCVTDKCYFTDEEGLIFALAPAFSKGVYFVYRTEEPINDPIGKSLITTEEFRLLSKFIETLHTLNIQSSMFEIGENEYHLSMLNGGQIIWHRESNLVTIYSNLEAFLSNDSVRAQKNFLDKILYLDLRTENKVFYKFKE